MNVPAITKTPGELLEAVIIRGDLAALSPAQRVEYYHKVCSTLGLNPLTQPFEFIVLNGKLKFYAKKDCTDQLRKINGVSVIDMSQGEREGVFVITAKVEDKSGRKDMATGAVTIATLRGEALANALMKAETKAKRRATLSICGLGFLDELEVDDIPRAPPRARPNVLLDPNDPSQHLPGTATEGTAPADPLPPPAAGAVTSQETNSERFARLDHELGLAADHGTEALQIKWDTLASPDRKSLVVALDRRHKPHAAEVDRRREEHPQ